MSSAIRMAAVVAAVGLAEPAMAQGVVMTPVPAPARLVEAYVHAVADLDRAVAFYRDVVGLPEASAPGAAAADPWLQRLSDTPGALTRTAVFDLPGTDTALRLIEFSGVDRRPQHPRPTDPGASTLVLTVRDPASILDAARTFEPTPVVVAPDGRVALLTDPDGFYVELVRTDAGAAGNDTTGAVDGNVLGVRLAFTLADSAPVVAFYRDVLGLAVTRGDESNRPWIVEPSPPGAAGPGGLTRTVQIARIPGRPLEWELVTFGGVEQTASLGRPQDPGTPAIVVHVPDVTVAARAVRERGLPIVSAGGVPAVRETAGAVLVRDPGGILLELSER